MSDYQLSVIVPAYNAEHTLEKCVESIVGSGNKSVECILIENGSTDNSWDICQKLKKKYENVKCFRNEEIGVSAARNCGLEKAVGDVIGFCDADDFWEKDVIEKILEEFQIDQDLKILVTGYFVTRKENGSYLQRAIRAHSKKYPSSRQLMKWVMCDSRIMGSVWNKFYRRDVIADIRFKTTLSCCEDTYFNINILSHRKKLKCKYIKEPLYNYVYNQASVTNSYEKLYDEKNQLKYIVACYDIINDFTLDYEMLSYVGYAIFTLAVGAIHDGHIDMTKKKILFNEVRKHKKDFMHNALKVNWKGSIKTIIRWIVLEVKEFIISDKEKKYY